MMVMYLKASAKEYENHLSKWYEFVIHNWHEAI